MQKGSSMCKKPFILTSLLACVGFLQLCMPSAFADSQKAKHPKMQKSSAVKTEKDTLVRLEKVVSRLETIVKYLEQKGQKPTVASIRHPRFSTDHGKQSKKQYKPHREVHKNERDKHSQGSHRSHSRSGLAHRNHGSRKNAQHRPCPHCNAKHLTHEKNRQHNLAHPPGWSARPQHAPQPPHLPAPPDRPMHQKQSPNSGHKQLHNKSRDHHSPHDHKPHPDGRRVMDQHGPKNAPVHNQHHGKPKDSAGHHAGSNDRPQEHVEPHGAGPHSAGSHRQQDHNKHHPPARSGAHPHPDHSRAPRAGMPPQQKDSFENSQRRMKEEMGKILEAKQVAMHKQIDKINKDAERKIQEMEKHIHMLKKELMELKQKK